ncbi:MAG: hypothetical protein ACJ8R9_09625 [Steroidobacteraceae bacterium]
MRILIATILLLFACFEAGAVTLSARPTCTCTVSFPGAKSTEVAGQFKRGTCHCALSDPRDTAQSSSKMDIHELPPDHSGSAVTPDHSGPAVAVAILTLVLVTGSQAVYTAKLWKSTRRLADRGEATAHRQLRAYVAVSDVVYEPSIAGQPPRVTVTIQNFGVTPAYKLAVALDAQIVSDEQQLSVATSTSRTLGHLPPGVEFAIARSALLCPGTVPRDEVDSARSVFVHGCIEYIDTFGDPHFTRFRLQDGPAQKFFACREGNETDDVLLSRSRGI